MMHNLEWAYCEYDLGYLMISSGVTLWPQTGKPKQSPNPRPIMGTPPLPLGPLSRCQAVRATSQKLQCRQQLFQLWQHMPPNELRLADHLKESPIV